jgi:predicted acylesterase/phospholipase RssA
MSTKKAAIISGGGAFGAYGAGTLAAWDEDYQVVAGVSTGALMGGLVAIRAWDQLKEGYTNVKNKDIFDYKWYRPKPFTKKGKLNPLSIIYALLFSKETFGHTTKSLDRTIQKFFTEEHYLEARGLGKDVIVACQNMKERPSRVHYFNLQEESYDDFKDWMRFSANAPFAMSLEKKDFIDSSGEVPVSREGEWTDGGLTELFSLDKVLELGCKEIDLIIHREKINKYQDLKYTKNLIDNALRSFEAMRFDIELEDGRLHQKLEKISKECDIKIRVAWLGRKLGDNSLQFDKKIMTEWWDEGYATANDATRIDYYGY